MEKKESFDIDGLMVFEGDYTARDQDGNVVAGVITPDRYKQKDREPLSSEQTGRYTNTTAYWKDHSDIVPAKGDMYIYSDGGTVTQGGVTINVPKIKIGDGVTTIDNLPFTDSDTQGGIAGTLNTTNTAAQTPTASESLSGTVNLHEVAKTGDYRSLHHQPTIPAVNDAVLTIQRNGTTVDTFSANASQNKTINITVPTTASDVGALPSSTKYGASLSLSIDSSTYVVTAQLKDQDGNNLGTAQTIDLPLESVVVSGSYNAQTKKVVLTLQNGSTIEFSVADLVAGLQSEITAQNPLSADLVVDGTTNKVFTLTMKTKLDGIEAGAEVNVQSDWSQTDNTADDFIKHKPIEIIKITETTANNVVTYSCDKDSLDFYNIISSGAEMFFVFIDGQGSIYHLDTCTFFALAESNYLYFETRLYVYKDEYDYRLIIDISYNNAPAEGTQVTVSAYSEGGIRSDWNETNTNSLSYIKNKPTIPSAANNGILTLQQNGTTLGTFSANQSSNKTINVTTKEDFVCTFTYQIDDNSEEEFPKNAIWSCDKTIAQIHTAVVNGDNIIGKITVSEDDYYIINVLRFAGEALSNNNYGYLFHCVCHFGLNIINFILFGSRNNNADKWNADMSFDSQDVSNLNNLATVATSGSYNDLTNKPTIPTVPTNVSSFTNDAGYITNSDLPTIDTELSETSTNPVQNKAIGTELRKLWENVDVVSRLDDSYEQHNGYISSSTGSWNSSTTYKHWVVPVDKMRRVVITANSNTDAYYTFFATYTGSSSVPTTTYATGYSNVVKVDAGTSASVVVPCDANYMYLNTGSSGAAKAESIVLTGIGVTEHCGTSSQVVRADGTVANVVTVYSGSSAPSSSLGSNGDIYIQTTA